MTPFVRWGPGHIGAILLTVAVPLLLAAWARRDPSGRRARWCAAGFAAVLLIQAIQLFVWGRRGRATIWTDLLPMHLCDWALLACVVACLARRQLAFELAYFWGLAGTLQGLITPDLEFGFPSAHFFSFFVGHGGIIASVLFLVAALGFRPRWSSVARAYAGLLIYAVLAAGVNSVAGTNFGYLRAKPDVPSLLDHLGPWPWYIASLAAIGIVNFTLLHLPWAVADRVRRGRTRATAP
jgi:hypothetical integral membrane protein (TIGR02206 family)